MADTTTGHPGAIQLDEAARLRVLRALGRMPYAAGIFPMRINERLTVDELLTYLDKLADRLTEVVEYNNVRDAELERLRNLMRGGRHLLAELLAGVDLTDRP